MANVWKGTVYSFDAQHSSRHGADPLFVGYPREVIPCTRSIGRLLLPWPSRGLWRLLRSPHPLHGHLPCPGVLLVIVLARLLQPHRRVTAHWHSFLKPSPDLNGLLFGVYQWLALRLIPHLSGVVTTSPLLADELVRCGVSVQRVLVLACCLSEEQERRSLEIPIRGIGSIHSLRLIFIGRLDSYKRLDWLLHALATLPGDWHLDVVGDGPHRRQFEDLSRCLTNGPQRIAFRGRVSEQRKTDLLAEADVLVLPSDRCNEAFGIVQLEAMAAGLPSLAFQCPRSGMGWVGQLPGLAWSQSREDLPAVLQHLSADPSLRAELSLQARGRYQRLFARKIWERDLQALTS